MAPSMDKFPVGFGGALIQGKRRNSFGLAGKGEIAFHGGGILVRGKVSRSFRLPKRVEIPLGRGDVRNVRRDGKSIRFEIAPYSAREGKKPGFMTLTLQHEAIAAALAEQLGAGRE